jgi:hypothetical protein
MLLDEIMYQTIYGALVNDWVQELHIASGFHLCPLFSLPNESHLILKNQSFV